MTINFDFGPKSLSFVVLEIYTNIQIYHDGSRSTPRIILCMRTFARHEISSKFVLERSSISYSSRDIRVLYIFLAILTTYLAISPETTPVWFWSSSKLDHGWSFWCAIDADLLELSWCQTYIVPTLGLKFTMLQT